MKRLALTALVLTALVSGCAGAGPAAAPETPSPTAACPFVEDAPQDPGCAYYDPDQAMAQNDAYREELPTEPQALADAEGLLPSARAALEPLGPDASEAEVSAVLQELGFSPEDIQISSRDGLGGYPFGVFTGGACITGWWTSTPELMLEAGGLIADGGCLTAPGH
ncbi:hypothetical protein [Desertivibrio insolitus]|uniref:hypothetical protein n=1 Tax=Herbiconiux sp. SYSU D00978 TaxID=2812562 RepID=UPI001A9602A4|nr:hypothetical protein [Herbiconiux sp. SYSU D00978]